MKTWMWVVGAVVVGGGGFLLYRASRPVISDVSVSSVVYNPQTMSWDVFATEKMMDNSVQQHVFITSIPGFPTGAPSDVTVQAAVQNLVPIGASVHVPLA
jgi:hypothetical protein